MALAVMDTLRFELGLRVPEDVAVAGFDDVPIAGWPSYRLTSVRQDVDGMVADAVRLTIARVEGRTEPAPSPRPVTLSVRASTAG